MTPWHRNKHCLVKNGVIFETVSLDCAWFSAYDSNVAVAAREGFQQLWCSSLDERQRYLWKASPCFGGRLRDEPRHSGRKGAYSQPAELSLQEGLYVALAVA